MCTIMHDFMGKKKLLAFDQYRSRDRYIYRGVGIFAFSVFFVCQPQEGGGSRKINGGTEWAIQRQLNRDFVVLTLWACLFSIPLGYYLISSWLEKFACRIELNWYFFILVALCCLTFVCLVVTWQIRKIVTLNPVECLKEL